jgi:hypothetical protein
MFLLLTALIFIMSLFGIFSFSILFSHSLKYFKRTRLPHWQFPDYVSVGYFGYLVNKYADKF